MTPARALLAAGVLPVGAWLAFATPVHADDCASRVQSAQDVGNAASVQDCLRTGQNYGKVVGAVVTGAGVVIALVGLPGRVPTPPRPLLPQPPLEQPPARRTEPETVHHADPCFDQQVRYTTARVASSTSFRALETLRTQRAYLDELWESTRETGYLNAVIDVAMMAGSVLAKPTAAVMGITLAKETLTGKVAEALLKPLGKELAKDLVRHLEDQPIEWRDLLGKVGESRTESLLQGLIKDQLTKLEFDRLSAEMGGAGNAPSMAVIEKTFSGPIAKAVGNALSLAKLGSSTWKVADKLSEIRKAISDVEDHISIADDLWRSAVSEMDLAHDSLGRCRELHGFGTG